MKGEKRGACVGTFVLLMRVESEKSGKMKRRVCLGLMTCKKAKKIILVTDNLNIHTEKTRTKVFGEKEGKKITRKIEWHYTPKHASWLNQAEIENHALSTQCLKRKIPTFQTMQHEISVETVS